MKLPTTMTTTTTTTTTTRLSQYFTAIYETQINIHDIHCYMINIYIDLNLPLYIIHLKSNQSYVKYKWFDAFLV